MVKSVGIGRFKSEKKNTEYFCLVFDLGWRKQKVFADSQSLLAISGMTSEQLYSLKLDEIKILIEIK